MTSFGVTASGFAAKRQSDIIADINTALNASFGQNVNLGGESVLGTTVGILTEPMALIWELAEAVYNSAFPAGAEGVSVDNILALANLKRASAAATVTNPNPTTSAAGITLFGLVLYGTPGTVVPQFSVIQTTDVTPLSFTLDSAVTIQAAVNAVQNVVLSGVATSGGFTLTLTGANGATYTTTSLAAGASAATVQAAIRALASGPLLPFTDVVVAAIGNGYQVSFGAASPSVGQPSSGAMAQPLMAYGANTLMNGSTVINIAVVETIQGAPAQGTGAATCSVTGPNTVPAGRLTVIGSPHSGWVSVTNQLDCVTGQNAESDTDALLRRIARLSQQGNGPLASIIAKVAAVADVDEVVGFQNLSNCAVQTLSFSAVPSSGFYSLQLSLGMTAPIAATATATTLQGAINALGYTALVTGNAQYGFAIDYNGSLGGQAQPLVTIASNTTGVTITPGYGRPPKSFEIVVDGGSNTAIGSAILSAQPAGIASYGAPTAVTSGSSSAGSTTLTVASVTGIAVGNAVTGPGLLNGTTAVAVGVSTVTLNQGAATSQSGNYIFTNAVLVDDSQGNTQLIAFSRPIQVLPYVAVALLTDYYYVAGNAASGVNQFAKFSPTTIPAIQADIVAIGNALSLGALIVGQGSNGIVGAFNTVPGILSYGIAIALGAPPTPPSATSPTVPPNIQLLPEQEALFEALNVQVSWS